MRLRAVSVALLAAAVVFCALHAIGWPERQLSVDVRSAYHPKQEAAAEALRAGRLPLWNPFEFNGIPLMAIGSASVLYPPVAAAALAVPQPRAEEILAAAHLALFFAGFAFVIGAAGGSAGSAVIGATLALCVSLAGVTLQSPHLLASLAWVPLLLHLARRASDEGSAAQVAALGLAFGMQLLAGYPDYALDTAVLIAAAEIGEAKRSLAPRLLRLAAGLALGGAIAAVQLLPLAELVRESSRGNPGTNLAAILPGALWLRSIVASARGVIERFGWAFVVLAAAGVTLSRTPARGWLFAFVWATWALWFPFSLLYLLPPWSASRAPIGWLAVGPVFLGLLAANALDRCRRSGQPWLVAPALALAALGVWHGARRIQAFDGVIEIHDASPDLIRQRASALRQLQAEVGPDAGILAWPEAWNGSFLRFRLRSPAGSEPSRLTPRRTVALLSAIHVPPNPTPPQSWRRLEENADLAALLGVGLVAGLPPWLVGLDEQGFIDVGALPAEDRVLFRPPLPRARLVHRAVVVADEKASLARVVKHAGEASTSAVLEVGTPPPELAEAPAGAVESAAIEVDEPERVEIVTDVASPALLVLRDTFFPGWRARVDGLPAEIVRADYAFRGVALAPGRHRVVFEYAPLSVRLGLWVSGVAAFVTALLLTSGVRRRHPSPPAAGRSR